MKEKFLSTKGFDLLKQLLTLDPVKRISVTLALSHPWFYENPLPCDIDLMPKFKPMNDKRRD